MSVQSKIWVPNWFRKLFLSTLGLGSFSFMYFSFIGNKLELIGKNSPHNIETIQYIYQFRMPYYRTSFMLPIRCLEIIYGSLFDNKHFFRYDREIIHSYDGENLALDWGSLHAKFEDKNQDLSKVPIVVLLPGLSGSSNASYIKATMNKLRSGGFRPVVFNSRGSGVPQISDNIFDYRYTEKDLQVALDHVHQKYPKANIYFMGFSYGSSYGTNVFSENQDLVKGMVCVANPFNMYKAGESLNSRWNRVYS